MSRLVNRDIEDARAALGIDPHAVVDAELVERRWREVQDSDGSVAEGSAPTRRQADDARETLLEWIGLGRPDLDAEHRIAGIARLAARSEIEAERTKVKGFRYWAGRGALVAIGFVLVAAVLAAVFPGGPECDILHVDSESRVYTINGEPDAGHRVEVVVENRGGEGEVVLEITLDSSQGMWVRSWQGRMARGERTTVAGDFHEPTIGATAIKPAARCSDL